jgi:hypothetical protein
VLAAVVSGVAKVFNAFIRATASALATTRELSAVNLLGWVSLAVGLLAAIVGARWGLSGLIYGVALGWLMRSVSALYVVARHLRLPGAEQAAEPATAP